MEPGKGAGDEANYEAVGRSRFRLSFTVAVLQLAVAVIGVGVVLLVARQGDETSKGGQRTRYPASQISNEANPGVPTRSAGRVSITHGSSNSRTVARPSGRPAPGSPKSLSAHTAGWPVGFAGYTVALASDIIRSDAVGAVAKARTAGLHDVGILRSDRYASLKPGYWFVFSGVYATVEEARHDVAAAVDAGFSDAYVRGVAE
jgi:F0F1-type ATP synthase membrane subunit c/vacuolar-type H+-ATPase subunit K